MRYYWDPRGASHIILIRSGRVIRQKTVKPDVIEPHRTRLQMRYYSDPRGASHRIMLIRSGRVICQKTVKPDVIEWAYEEVDDAET
jgi:hypothetical protein